MFRLPATFSLLGLFASLFLLTGCNNDSQAENAAPTVRERTPNPAQFYLKQARAFAQQHIILDGHVDLPSRLKTNGVRLEKENLQVIERDQGTFDYVKAKMGGLDAPFMPIYIAASKQEIPGQAKALADSLIDIVETIAELYPDKFALAHTPEDIQVNFRKGLISLPMGMENGAPIEEDLDKLAYFYERGIRYITLTHSKDNKICDSSHDTTHTWKGLSPFGRQVVAEMNRLGIMIDISNVSDDAFYQVMDLTTAPVIASHSACRAFIPDFERNMSDDMLKRLAENGGVIQISFVSSVVDSAIKAQRDQVNAILNRWSQSSGISTEDPAYKVYEQELYKQYGYPYAQLTKIADHIDHVVKLVGIEHVGLGSDFEGVGANLPIGLRNVSMYPNLIAELMARGYTESDLEKICYLNVFRVWNQVSLQAQQQASL